MLAPALQPRVRRATQGLAVLSVVATAIVVLALGSGVSILDLALVGLVALLSLGLAGAVSFSAHRGRAMLAGLALLGVAAGTFWVLVRAFLAAPR